jgi:hypothetical protein
MVVVDRLSKMAHFIPTRDDANAPGTTRLFLDNIYKLHGMPDLVTSDRDSKFVSNFWQEFFRYLSTKLKLSSSKYLQTNGQFERTIQTLEEYL